MYSINESKFIFVLTLLFSPTFHNATKLEISFCGFEQTCSRSASKPKPATTGCCRPCECDDICREKGTCCRDKKEFIDQHFDVNQKCLASAYVPNGFSVPSNILSYYNRISCPTAFNDINIRAKCEGDKLKTISDIRPVSSHDGNVVYKNKYCSHCHGERKTYGWKTIVHVASPPSCRTILQEETLDIDTITSKVLSNCILVFIPPKQIAFLKVLCFDDSFVIKRCNSTGKWKIFDNELNNLCLNRTDTGYYIFNGFGKVYHNLYCSMCNGYLKESLLTCMSTLTRFPARSVFTLININKLLDQDVSKSESRRCQNSEILDTFFNICRTLYCFWNSIPFQGKCVPFVDYVEGMGYELEVKSVPMKKIMISDLSKNALWRHFKSIRQKMNFMHCKLCYLEMFTEKDNPLDSLEEIYSSFAFTSTAKCTIERIWSIFTAAETILPLHLNLTVNEEIVTFKVIWEDLPPKQRNNLFNTGSINNCKPYKPARGELCPKIKLLRYEVESVMKYHPRADKLIWVKSHEFNNGSAFICSNRYISYQHSLSSLKCQSCLLVISINVLLRVLSVLMY